MIIAETRDTLYGLSSIFTSNKIDESESLGRKTHLELFGRLCLILEIKDVSVMSIFKTEIHSNTLDWLVILSLARYIRDMGPNGRNRSCRSDSLVSSDKLVTRIVAVSSVK